MPKKVDSAKQQEVAAQVYPEGKETDRWQRLGWHKNTGENEKRFAFYNTKYSELPEIKPLHPCNDLLDNDCDGKTDCEDRDCDCFCLRKDYKSWWSSSIDGTRKVLGIEMLPENPDLFIMPELLTLYNVTYKDELCGYPSSYELKMTIGGMWYTKRFGLIEANLFEVIRNKTIFDFPPKVIVEAFDKPREELFVPNHWINDKAQKIWTNVWIEEEITLKAEYDREQGQIKYKLIDEVNIYMWKKGGKLVTTKKKLKRETEGGITIISTSPQPTTQIASLDQYWKGQIDKVIKNFLDAPEKMKDFVKEPFYKEGAYFVPTYKPDFSEMHLHNKKKKECCSKDSITCEEKSIYILRDLNNYSLEGIGYQILTNQSVISTKTFLNYNLDYPRIEKYEDLDFCDTSLIKQENISGNITNFITSDNKFEISFDELTEINLTINKINISNCNLSFKIHVYNSSYSYVNISELDLKINVEDVLYSSKYYTYGHISLDKLTEIARKWVEGS